MGISSLVVFTGLANTRHFGGARGDKVQSKLLHCPFDACGSVSLRAFMHRATVV